MPRAPPGVPSRRGKGQTQFLGWVEVAFHGEQRGGEGRGTALRVTVERRTRGKETYEGERKNGRKEEEDRPSARATEREREKARERKTAKK